MEFKFKKKKSINLIFEYNFNESKIKKRNENCMPSVSLDYIEFLFVFKCFGLNIFAGIHVLSSSWTE